METTSKPKADVKERSVTADLDQSAKYPLSIVTTDEPGHKGANHEYEIRWNGPSGNPEAATIYFAHDHVPGVTEEALLAVIIDRLQSVQNGPKATDATAEALADAETFKQSLAARNVPESKKERVAKKSGAESEARNLESARNASDARNLPADQARVAADDLRR